MTQAYLMELGKRRYQRVVEGWGLMIAVAPLKPDGCSNLVGASVSGPPSSNSFSSLFRTLSSLKISSSERSKMHAGSK